VKTPLIRSVRLRWLCKVIGTDLRVSKVDWQRVPDRRTSDSEGRWRGAISRWRQSGDVRDWCAAVDQLLRSLML